MTDYYPPIQRAVQALSPNTAEARTAMYDRARTALLKQLRSMTPSMPEEQITRERMALEDAMRRVEAEIAEVETAAQPATDLIDEPVQPAAAVPRRSETREPIQAERRAPDGRPGRGRLIAAGVAVVAILALGGAGALYAMRQQGGTRTALVVPTSTETTAPAASSQPAGSGKLLDRLTPGGDTSSTPSGSATPDNSGARPVSTSTVTASQESAAPSSSTAQPLAPVAADAGPAVAQKAVLIQEETTPGQSQTSTGAVTWRTESVAGDANGPLDLAIRGDVDIPERKLKAQITLRRNLDPALPATHTLQIQFSVPKDFPDKGIDSVSGVLMKVGEAARGAPLAGLSVKVTNGYFLIGLNNGPGDSGRNEQLLRERDWLDIPLAFEDGKRALLTLEKGVPGDRAFNDAFAAWGTATTASTPAAGTPAQTDTAPPAGDGQD